jgi:hypothetical protein
MAHRRAQEAEFVVSAEDVASAVYRATLESAVRAAVELWHKHHGARRVYISKSSGQIVKTLPPGDVLAIGNAPASRITKRKKPVRHIMANVERANHVETCRLCDAPEDAYPLLAKISAVTCPKCLGEVVKRGIQA